MIRDDKDGRKPSGMAFLGVLWTVACVIVLALLLHRHLRPVHSDCRMTYMRPLYQPVIVQH